MRIAIYYTPPPTSPLARWAMQWFGRDALCRCCPNHQPASSVSKERYRTLLSGPFHYGFHATIKAPFHLAPGVTLEDIYTSMASFTANQKRFLLPPLEVALLDDFFALRPTEPCRELSLLAEMAVRWFDEFRRPPDKEELARRRSARLSANQERLLRAWGYPYVMEEYRFHMTLTGKTADDRERRHLQEELENRFDRRCLRDLPFSALSLFIEENHKPMRLLKSFALGHPYSPYNGEQAATHPTTQKTL